MNEKLPLPTLPAPFGVVGIDNEDYRYEPSSYVEATETTTNELTSQLYRYASLGSLGGTGVAGLDSAGGGGGGGGGVGIGMPTISANVDDFLTGVGLGGGIGGGTFAADAGAGAVPTEFGGTLKSSKGSSNINSPHKQMRRHGSSSSSSNSYCDCFGRGNGAGGKKMPAVSFWPALLANLGICTLLLGYLFIGSFVFLTIENSGDNDGDVATSATIGDSALWQLAQKSQITASQQQLQQQHNQQQHQQLKPSQIAHKFVKSTTIEEGGSTASIPSQSIAMHIHQDNATINSNNNNKNNKNRNNNINTKTHIPNVSAAATSSASAALSASVGVIATPETETRIDNMHVNDNGYDNGNADIISTHNINVDYELQTMNIDDNDNASADNDDNVADGKMADEELERTVANIWEITVSLNILYKENWTKLASLEISRFQDQLVKRLVMDLTLSTTNDAHQKATAAVARTRNTLLQNLNVMSQNTKHINGHQQQYQQQTRQYQQQQQQRRSHFWQLKHARHIRRQQNFEWNFATAFLYSLTVITTVGYGTITPRTILGRMVTIAYATLGIPLTLIYLSSIGSILAKLATALCTRAFGCCRRQSYCGGFSRQQQVTDKKKCNLKLKQLHHHHQHQHQQQQQQMQQQQHLPYCYVRPPAAPTSATAADINAEAASTTHMLGGSTSFDTLNMSSSMCELHHTHTHATTLRWSLVVPVCFCLLLLFVYVGFGSVAISLLEQWSLFDGIYFCFMSLTTIGFCDLLPGTNPRSPASTSTFVVWFCAAYILSGLTLTSMCVNMLHEEILLRMRVVVKFKKISATKETTIKEHSFYGAPPP